jgi:ectoine hydroxylase-related dioxygenase (phytanoyl-CoA dioxygenase family)
LYQHCPGHVGGLQIPQQLFRVGDAVPVPMERGDVLFLTSRTCHASLSNVSDKVRWSFDLRYNPTGQPTGRGAFPGFVARSRANPESELRKAEDWAGLWYETRRRLSEEQLKGPFNRWNADDPACA